MSEPVQSLDEAESGADKLMTLITPSGGTYSLPAKAFDYSPALGLMTLFCSDEVIEFNMEEQLQILKGKADSTEVGGCLDHALYGVPEKFYQVVFAHLNQLLKDKGVMPKIRDHCTMYEPELVAPKQYWPLVKSLTIDEIIAFDQVTLFFGIDSLRDLNELAMAYWVVNHPKEVDEYVHLLRPIVERDAVKGANRAARRARENASS